MYKDWEGTVYPRPKPPRFDQLRYISEFFDAIEINSSFYGPPLATSSSSWVRRVEDNVNFRFTAKLWRRFTHERAKAWTTAEVDQVRAGFDVLMASDRLGAVLLQFPWSFRHTEQNREWLGDVVRTFTLYPLVLCWMWLRRRSFDAVIDCQNGIPFFTPWVLPRRTPVFCVIHHVHDGQFGLYFPPWLAWIGRMLEGPVARWTYRRHACVVVSLTTLRALRERLRWRGRRRCVTAFVARSCCA